MVMNDSEKINIIFWMVWIILGGTFMEVFDDVCDCVSGTSFRGVRWSLRAAGYITVQRLIW
jgi:hypothetical protein